MKFCGVICVVDALAVLLVWLSTENKNEGLRQAALDFTATCLMSVVLAAVLSAVISALPFYQHKYRSTFFCSLPYSFALITILIITFS